MSREFSQTLIRQCKEIISKRSGVEINDDQAEAYLGTLARIGLLALRIFEERKKTDKHGKL